jgi:hypothetical protein
MSDVERATQRFRDVVYGLYRVNGYRSVEEVKALPGSIMADSYPFVSRKAQLIFILTVMDGRSRNDQLGIQPIHYASKRHANNWYDEIVRELGPEDDANTHAYRQLERIHRIMLDH